VQLGRVKSRKCCVIGYVGKGYSKSVIKMESDMVLQGIWTWWWITRGSVGWWGGRRVYV